MPIRPATYADLVPAAKVLAKAFFNEPLYGQYMHPHREQYPDDVYLTFLHKLRLAWLGSMDQVLVSYKSNPEDTSKEIITGCAHWNRISSSSGDGWLTTAKIAAMKTYSYLESFAYPNRAADPSRLPILSEAGPYCAHFWTGTRSEVWDLVLLGVDPSQGRQGFGKELVAWGFEKAKGEGVGCSVTSSQGNEGWYQRCGFETLVGWVGEQGGMRNPIKREGIPGGAVLFWDNGRGTEGVEEYVEK
ncbi:unnamed protein product [Zymoseptoria tritici ST99CH_1A5]|uniref:N-acetyltransferase domain-containing protein n=3 Tax=Zymoseptoria tritici TaxID=1047171 RepID=F9XLJ9_ZYMTI|nr:uncharacterized protein MYCGRDRAFT_49004 [Zymoseptoria tritici IPO323]EGP84152.1 hypothetical protein MYCGRDRAFT_49004 [Zymoseptoria tritici IPO323]SMR59018.1 unnamed protein product [Zymoseptoria tritici ST99CH_1E4]SMY28229.1 unnamed protein product [Zymoseptoria tritici ST99CH_1A5]